MIPVLEHLPPEAQESFFAKAFDTPYFATPWHYHPECELVLILKSHGTRFIGNSVSEFNEGDLSFLGPNLPHLYRNAPAYYEDNAGCSAQSIVIHFSERSLGLDFINLPQAKKIRSLFKLAGQGMDITGKTREEIVLKMHRLLAVKEMDRLICLLEILNQLAGTEEYSLISDPGFIGYNINDVDRLDKVLQYTLQNYERSIRLEEVASLLYMTRTSFCRFFRERTKKSFFSFLNNIRLNQACKMLIDTNKSIADIIYSCGFNNLSNFNRQFKAKFSISPSVYRRTAGTAFRA